MTRVAIRTLEIASAALSGDIPDGELAAIYGLSVERIRAIRRSAGVSRSVGRARSSAVTSRGARGRDLLARLVADAAAARVEPEDYLHAARCRLATDRIEPCKEIV